ncbi:hypothetical protein BJ508DRAFT_419281 [Ascobolus immersus RN42]|uniref:PIN domain-containing protein n=1 Tax=Ascobolus immersus RN42 TaxID=1160509 RepID=A0A3N4HT37_ASCIM|nr:hypothetical protein BJ508DRAFT_419281 [Ascobolus immersus RN42]
MSTMMAFNRYLCTVAKSPPLLPTMALTVRRAPENRSGMGGSLSRSSEANGQFAGARAFSCTGAFLYRRINPLPPFQTRPATHSARIPTHSANTLPHPHPPRISPVCLSSDWPIPVQTTSPDDIIQRLSDALSVGDKQSLLKFLIGAFPATRILTCDVPTYNPPLSKKESDERAATTVEFLELRTQELDGASLEVIRMKKIVRRAISMLIQNGILRCVTPEEFFAALGGDLPTAADRPSWPPLVATGSSQNHLEAHRFVADTNILSYIVKYGAAQCHFQGLGLEKFCFGNGGLPLWIPLAALKECRGGTEQILPRELDEAYHPSAVWEVYKKVIHTFDLNFREQDLPEQGRRYDMSRRLLTRWISSQVDQGVRDRWKDKRRSMGKDLELVVRASTEGSVFVTSDHPFCSTWSVPLRRILGVKIEHVRLLPRRVKGERPSGSVGAKPPKQG